MAIWQEGVATRDALSWELATAGSRESKRAYRTLYLAYGTYLLDDSMLWQNPTNAPDPRDAMLQVWQLHASRIHRGDGRRLDGGGSCETLGGAACACTIACTNASPSW